MLAAIPVLIGVSILVFLIIHFIPGDPARQIAGMDAPAADVEEVRRTLGLTDPLYVQYFRYAGNALQGDFGRSLHTQRPVLDDIVERFPITLNLAFLSIVVAVVVGVGAGVLSAVRRYTIADHLSMFGALLGISMPVFLIGFLLVWAFSLGVRWFPSGGLNGAAYSLTWLHHMVLPVITLAWTSTGLVARLTRSSMLEALSQDYIRTARAKGLNSRMVNYKHALRNSLIPISTYIGLEFGFLLGGAVVTETIFSLPGMGRFMIQAIVSRDYPVIQACILFIAAAFVLVNLLVDLMYSVIDPRIRYSG